jgi:hypothetical protein
MLHATCVLHAACRVPWARFISAHSSNSICPDPSVSTSRISACQAEELARRKRDPSVPLNDWCVSTAGQHL